ncbi:MAG: SUMF1/EgtB/PvdO family nonheme iron enzyme [Alphaproteobacteria bacterium]|nr:SUMF1/EgtB/PvdO family nonheme iron enzyme [Alphaproteobacteria bacterium]
MSEQSVERQIKLASIVSIDIVGFSTMSEKDQKKAARNVEQLNARIATVAAAHGGRIFNTAGDGFMLEFPSAGAALGAMSDLLDKRPKGEPEIRVGAHIGDVVVTANNDLLGHGVNVAARLQSLAVPGTALVSGEFRSMARNSPSAAFQSKGRHPLENIDQKVETFEILPPRVQFQRRLRRYAMLAVAVALLGAGAWFAPKGYELAKSSGLLARVSIPGVKLSDASASAPKPETAAPAPAPVPAPPPPPAPIEPVRKPGETFTDCADCPQMVVVPGGLFTMGSAAKEKGRFPDEGPERQVTLPTFAVSATEITFAQWDACANSGGCAGFYPLDRGFGRGSKPVIGVSWNDAQAYLRWLNGRHQGRAYRLLSEAEWEYIARAGTTTPYATGKTITAAAARFGAKSTVDVASLPANPFGLFEVPGNAAELVADCYVPSYEGAPADGAAVDRAPCAQRVYRGGSYQTPAANLRSANRRRADPDQRTADLGFRVARPID